METPGKITLNNYSKINMSTEQWNAEPKWNAEKYKS